MNKKRRQFSTKFKAKVALEAAKELRTIKQLSSQFELSGSQVVKWKSQLLAGLPQLFESRSNKEKKNKEESDHFARLYEEIGRLKMERDYLEKKIEQYG